MLEQQAVDGLGSAGRQLPPQRAVEGADRDTGVDDEHPGALGVHVLVRHRGRIGGELPDDLLENVLERDQSLDVAVLVDDEGEPAAIALELSELHIEGGSLGHEVRLTAAGDLDETLAAQGAAHQLVRHALHVQQADEVVELAFVHRQARVRGLSQLIKNVLPALAHVDAGDLLPRNHDVVHRDVPQVEDRQQHLPVTRGNDRRGFRHYGAQLFGTQGLSRVGGAHHSEQAQEAVSERAGEPQRRARHQHQHAIDARGVQRHAFGV